MQPIKFKGHTRLLGKPENTTDDECAALPVKDTAFQFEAGPANCFESVWELSPEELEQVKKTGKIKLGIISDIHPVVYMHATDDEKAEDE